MSRRRTAGAPRSPYITRDGWEALRQEQDRLWKKRRIVVQHLAAAAAEGDRSENAEYVYRKKQLRELDRRIRYLQKRLPELKIVDARPDDTEQVFFGAWIRVQDLTGQTRDFRIVGADEFDPKRNWISVDSPMAKALLQRRVDDEITLQTPGGRAEMMIVDVRYSGPVK